jgi:hypothetical protein
MPRQIASRLHVLAAMLLRTISSLFSTIRQRDTSGPPQLPDHVPSPVSLDFSHVRWLREMALKYNCGSMNKTLRDLLDFFSHTAACELDEILESEMRHGPQQRPFYGLRQIPAPVRESPSHVSVDSSYRPNISKVQSRWIQRTSATYGLEPSVLLARLVQFAINELDDELLFENISGMARCTADLYADITVTQD